MRAFLPMVTSTSEPSCERVRVWILWYLSEPLFIKIPGLFKLLVRLFFQECMCYVYTPMVKKTTQAKKALTAQPITPMPRPNVSIVYIGSVIGLCKQNGIKYFKTGDLELHFSDKDAPLENPVIKDRQEVSDNANDDLADLLLSDPLAYEEAMNG